MAPEPPRRDGVVGLDGVEAIVVFSGRNVDLKKFGIARSGREKKLSLSPKGALSSQG
jgi:hypothetical protein